MVLDSSVFQIDAAAYAGRVEAFIRERMASLRRDGVLVPFSGGLDSSTVLLLCARAVGHERVTALLMPERQGNPDAERYARRVAGQFQIKTIRRDISPILSKLGTYNFALSYLPTRALKVWAAQKFLQSAGENPFLKIVSGTAGAFERKGFARFNSKHRARAVVEYLIAEETNALVVGCAHKSEDLLGLYVKFGVDDSADLMPLKNLYRTHILYLAREVGVPGEIIQRTPNPDIIPGVSDKYVDLLGLASPVLDLILYGIEHEMSDADIAGQLSLPPAKVKEIRLLVQQTAHMRSPSQTLAWEEG
jgi:NAD+ synthase